MLAHEALSRLAKERAKADFEEGKWLLAALREAVHVQLGYGSFSEYVGRLFGYAPRWAQEKLRVAEALEELPKTNEALASGSVNWSVARELTRVATPETETEWLDAAKNRTARQVEVLVAGKRPGDTPSSPTRPELRKHVLPRFRRRRLRPFAKPCASSVVALPWRSMTTAHSWQWRAWYSAARRTRGARATRLR